MAWNRQLPLRAALYLVLVLTSIVFLMPLYWMVVTSLSAPDEVASFPPPLLPAWVWSNYAAVLRTADWTRFFANTALIATATSALSIATSSLGGYALAAIPFRGKRLVFGLVIAAYVIPVETTLVPNFIFFRALGWVNTYWVQIVPFAVNPFGIFLMRQVFLTMPRDYWEAAQLDSCSHLQYLLRIAIPYGRPAVVTVGLISFCAAWNMFQWPLIFTTDETVRPIQVALSYFNNAEGSSEPTLLASAAVLATAPALMILIVGQRHLTEGVASGGLRL